MLIILDTNSLYGKWNFKNKELESFFSYAQKTRSKILIPEIVWNEIEKNYREEFIDKREKYASAARHFSSTLIEDANFIINEADIEEQTKGYMTWLKQKLNTLGSNAIIPFNDTTLNRLVRRAVHRLPPFNKTNDKELKDALVWESVIDVLSNKNNYSENDICLISHDGAFGSPGQKDFLNETLQNEANILTTQTRTSPLIFYRTLTQFLSAHNTPIAGITIQGINNYLNSKEGVASLFPAIAQIHKETISSFASRMFNYKSGVITEISNSRLTELDLDFSYYVDSMPANNEFTIFCERQGKASLILTRPTTYMGQELIEEEAKIDLKFTLSMTYKDGVFDNLKGSTILRRVLKYWLVP